MKVESIKMGGLTRFRAPVAVDLAELPALVAVSGPNGAGKTTLLESVLAAIYRRTPSRGELHRICHGKDATLEVALSLNGSRFRLVHLLDVAGARPKSEAYAYDADSGACLAGPKVRDFDAWATRTFPPIEVLLASTFAPQGKQGNLLDATGGERKAVFARLLGLEQLQRQADLARGHAREAEQAAAEARRALAEVEGQAAGLEAAQTARDEAMAAQERARAAEAEAEAAVARAEEALRAWERARDEINARGLALKAEYDATLSARTAEQRAASQARADAMGAKARADQAAATLSVEVDILAAVERVEVLRGEIAEQEEAVRAAEAERDARAQARKDADAKVRQLEEQAERLATEAAENGERTLVAEARRDRIREVLADEEQIRLLAARHPEDVTALTAAAEAEQAARKALIAHRDEVEKWQSDLRILSARRGTLDAETKALTDAAGTVGQVPCHAEGIYAGCPLIAHATRAVTRLEAIAVEVAGLETERTELHKDFPPAADPLEQALMEAERALRACRERAAESDRAAACLPGLDRARADLLGIEAEIRNARARQAEAWRRREAVLDEIDSLNDQLPEIWRIADQAVVNTQSARSMLAATRSEFEATQRLAAKADNLPAAHRALEQAETDLYDATTRASEHEAEAARLNETLDFTTALLSAARIERDQHASRKPGDPATARESLEDARGRSRTAIAEVARTEAEVGRCLGAQARARELGTEISGYLGAQDRWQWLTKALGRDGVQALEIDQAGPEVADVANDLLTACYGPRFSLAIETTRQSADGKKQLEDMVIRVLDAERGHDGTVEDLSGGERVIVGEALGLAVAIFNARRAATPLETIIRDETAGALDPENAGRYVAMLRRAIVAGRFDRLLYVAHQPEVLEMADARILVDGGHVSIG